ncbi:MAG: hypothetical protein KC620_10075 [Myxococcales bacterium]|nr:hypothetical protein [Myxococcales bacterium]
MSARRQHAITLYQEALRKATEHAEASTAAAAAGDVARAQANMIAVQGWRAVVDTANAAETNDLLRCLKVDALAFFGDLSALVRDHRKPEESLDPSWPIEKLSLLTLLGRLAVLATKLTDKPATTNEAAASMLLTVRDVAGAADVDLTDPLDHAWTAVNSQTRLWGKNDARLLASAITHGILRRLVVEATP